MNRCQYCGSYYDEPKPYCDEYCRELHRAEKWVNAEAEKQEVLK